MYSYYFLCKLNTNCVFIFVAELLKIVYDAFNSREIEDVFIVPVSVSYEILPDDFDEMISEEKSNKKRSSVVSFVKNIWRCMWKSLGGVRVDFGQPFSFRVFVVLIFYVFKQI